MTLNLKIVHDGGDDYAALVKVTDEPNRIVQPGGSTDVCIHSGKTVGIYEIASEKPKAGGEEEAPAENVLGEGYEDKAGQPVKAEEAQE